MKKLLAGIRDFHVRVRPGYRERFAHLALGHAPDCLFVACSDSRVVPNLFASTDPGDLFVVRNVGNIVPPAREHADAVGAAVEFATRALSVRDIVVCGHSSCGAMRALSSGELPAGSEHLARWIAHAEPSKARLLRESRISAAIPDVDRLSRAHVLQQIDHLRAFPAVADGVADGRLTLHAWWFDLANAEVLAYDAQAGDFLPLVEREAVSAVGASS